MKLEMIRTHPKTFESLSFPNACLPARQALVGNPQQVHLGTGPDEASIRCPTKTFGHDNFGIGLRFLPLFFVLFFCVGCAKLAHLEELLTLQGLSEDRDQQDIYVRNHDERFERLLRAVKSNSINQFPDKKSFLKAFGNPLFTERVVWKGEDVEKWLYRYATKPFGSPKVYLYFDQAGKLKHWQYYPKEDADVSSIEETQVQIRS